MHLPEEVINVKDGDVVAVDLETYDPKLKTHGSGSISGSGFVCGIPIAYRDEKYYFPIKSVGATKTPKSQRLVDLVAGVAAEKLTKGLKTGDIYAVIEVDGEVEVVKGDHKSYPWHVKLKDGSKPILHLPKNREAGGKTLVHKSGKPYAVRNVSVVEGKFQGQTEAIKTQAIVENTTEEVNRLKGLDKKPDDGATLNIDGTQYTGGGLVVPAATKNTTQSELTPQMIEKFVKDNDGKIGTDGIVKVGLYKFPKSDQVSIDLNIVVPAKNEKIALEFGC